MKLKWPHIRIKSGIAAIAAMLVVFGLIGFAEKKIGEKRFEEVNVKIDNQGSIYFLNESDVLAMLASSGLVVTGANYSHVELKAIENVIKKNRFVEEVQVHKDLRGAMTIDISQKRPVARIIQENGPSAYISDSGDLLPMSNRYTARVMLLSGKGAVSMINNSQSRINGKQSLLKLIRFIETDKFWKAQIAQIEVDRHDEIILYPQISKQYVQFGKAENIEHKFEKLALFYKQILPQKGWNTYTRVDLRYKDQLICE